MEAKEAPKKYAPKFRKLADIRPGEHGYNVYVKVIEAEVSVAKKQDQSDLKIAQAKVGDETAVIKVRVVGEYADLFKVGSILAIRNGKSEVFQENHRLELDRWGKITLETGYKIDTVNDKHDMSATLYETKLVMKKEAKK